MRQNTSSPRSNLPFQCFHTCTAPGTNHKTVVLYVRGANPRRLSCKLVSFPQHEPKRVEMLYIGSKSGIHRFTAKLTVDEGDNFQWYCFKISLLYTRGAGVATEGGAGEGESLFQREALFMEGPGGGLNPFSKGKQKYAQSGRQNVEGLGGVPYPPP